MAIAIENLSAGRTVAGSGSTTVTITTTSTVAAGATVFVSAFGHTVSTITDNSGNGYTWTVDQSVLNGGGSCGLGRVYASAGIAIGTVITITYGGSANPRIAFSSSFTGVESVSANDQKNSRTGFNSQSWTTSSITPTVSPSLVIGLAASGGSAPATSTADAGWNEMDDGTSGTTNATWVYQIVADMTARNPTGASPGWSVSQSGADQGGVTANYKEGSAVVAAPKLRTVRSNLRL